MSHREPAPARPPAPAPRVTRPQAWVVMALLLACLCVAHAAQARVLKAGITRVTTGVATLEGVEVRLTWPDDGGEGTLSLRAARVDAPALGYRFRALAWQCPLRRDGAGGWRCDGALRAAGGPPMRLAVDLGTATTDALLARGSARIAVHRTAAAPDDTRIDLTAVPAAWAQALLTQAWADGRFGTGTLDGRLTVRVPARGPLRVDGTLAARDLGVDTPDGTLAAAGLGLRTRIDWRSSGALSTLVVDGALHGGELLAGPHYVVLPATPVELGMRVEGAPSGWRIRDFRWRDGAVLHATGDVDLAPDGTLRTADVAAASDEAGPLPARYLSGPLGGYGLSALTLDGAMAAAIRLDHEGLAGLDASFSALTVAAAERFRFDAIDGTVRFSRDAPLPSAIAWAGGELYALPFGAARLPMLSRDGQIALTEPANIDTIGGVIRFDRFVLRPPRGARGLEAAFGLTLDRLDVGALAASLGAPAFRGTLSGTIPDARYAGDRLVFEGGLEMKVFDGRIAVSSLAMERPFGVAPTLEADLAVSGVDLLAMTEVFDFGSVSGRLDGQVDGLRLVDWTPVAFDARFATVPRKGVRQRISQRAVQNISSVGDASFVTSLQGQLIGFFDDFGYRRIGLSCRLQNEVCEMGGLGEAAGTGSATGGFTIVQGAGIPRLNVVGFNRRVDWPTLVERVIAIGAGDVAPVVE